MHHTQSPGTTLSDKVCSARPLAGNSSVAPVFVADTSLSECCNCSTITSDSLGDLRFQDCDFTSQYLCNQQYSVTAVTTSTGSVVERYAYTAYGQPTFLDASGSPLTTQTSTLNARYLYTGREWDATLGLYHFRARWMSPKSGRFLGKDPIGFEGGLNTYEYVRGHCLTGADPAGLDRWANSPHMNPDYVWRGWHYHYFEGLGNPVDLGRIGLLDLFIERTQANIILALQDASLATMVDAKCVVAGNFSSEKKFRYIDTWNSTQGIGLFDPLYSLGNSRMKISYVSKTNWTCSLCCDRKVRLTYRETVAKVDFELQDAYTNPSDSWGYRWDDSIIASDHGKCVYNCYKKNAKQTNGRVDHPTLSRCLNKCTLLFPVQDRYDLIPGGIPYGITANFSRTYSPPTFDKPCF